MIASSAASRPSLNQAELGAAVTGRGGFWRAVIVTEQTRSTNDDLLAAARAGRPPGTAEGTVLVAEAQSAGRGRLGRSWVSPPRAALTFSVLLRPAAVPAARRGWVPLLAGVAIATALRAETAVPAWLKWPNDVLVHEAKLAGILAEQAGDAIVVGAGINTTTGRDELPGPQATSLALAGAAVTDRGALLTAILAELERQYLSWTRAAGDPDACGLRESYQRLCSTLGREVRVTLPGGAVVTGTAALVDQSGRLVVESASGPVPVSAGDVVHVR
ncbi:MAG TPA: biotin--[acetyl-CoA-carboxylase] ligase [Streptosporangiaceae bacterium]